MAMFEIESIHMLFFYVENERLSNEGNTARNGWCCVTPQLSILLLVEYKFTRVTKCAGNNPSDLRDN